MEPWERSVPLELSAPRASAEPGFSPPSKARRLVLRILGIGLLTFVILVVAGAIWLRCHLLASVAQESGERAMAGLVAPVVIERDALGTPTVRAANRQDAAAALGFLHGQERFFQMDLMRRAAAGELSELVGARALPVDRDHRLHRFRAVAEDSLRRAGADERAVVEAYARGVNAGLAALGAAPPEYLLLRATPAPWRPADSYLAVLAMFFTLNDSHATLEAELGWMKERLPRQLFDFLAPVGTEWDAPLIGDPIPTPPVPGADVIDLRKPAVQPAPPPAAPRRAADLQLAPAWGDGERAWGADLDGGHAAGSNNWAVSGAHTADGHALIANDMHLALGLPNTWYRAALRWRAPDGSERQVTGVTLPGTPGVAVGSNGHVAWAFTNSYGDFVDLVDLEPVPGDPSAYRTPAGPRRFEHRHERIRVRGQADRDLDILETVWGPVQPAAPRALRRRPRAVVWTAHFPEAVNLALFALEEARTIDEAVEAAHGAGIPPQNFTVADESGRIGWTIIGKIPRRIGFDGRTPTSWADGARRWDGWLTSGEVPALLDPPSGRIWTANARTVDGEMLARLGDSGYELGARAKQIRDDLLHLEHATPRDLLAIQLDDRALFLDRWRRLLLDTLTPAAVHQDPRRGDLRRALLATWTGRASIDSAAYLIVKDFRGLIGQSIWWSVAGIPPMQRFGATARQPTKQFEGPLWRILQERPPHLLDPRYKTWDDEILAAADLVLLDEQRAALQSSLPIGPAGLTWGQHNTLSLRHPLSRAVPFLSRWLDLSPHQLPGDRDMPRVQGPAFGASERLVVSPGHEDQGLFEMPAGESGHPLSPHYRDGEGAWERGDPTPFLPGKAVSTLRLVPGKG